MRVLIACEFSGVVRDAFLRHGHDAMSCDLLPTEVPGPHHQGDVRDILGDGWDLMIAHPPCTDLAVSGARWFAEKGADRQEEALEFVRTLVCAPIPRICIENPVSVISTRLFPDRKARPDQIIQPWMFGHGETKATCLWLKNLPKLLPTNVVEGREHRVHLAPPISRPLETTQPDLSRHRRGNGRSVGPPVTPSPVLPLHISPCIYAAQPLPVRSFGRMPSPCDTMVP